MRPQTEGELRRAESGPWEPWPPGGAERPKMNLVGSQRDVEGRGAGRIANRGKPMSAAPYVDARELDAPLKGHETEIFDQLGIDWRAGGAPCPYPNHKNGERIQRKCPRRGER